MCVVKKYFKRLEENKMQLLSDNDIGDSAMPSKLI